MDKNEGRIKLYYRITMSTIIILYFIINNKTLVDKMSVNFCNKPLAKVNLGFALCF